MFKHAVDENLSIALPEYGMTEELTALVIRNLDRLKPWMPWAVDNYSIEMCHGFIKRSLEAYAENGRFEGIMMVGDKPVGTIGFHNYDPPHRNAHIGYWIDKDYEGQGIVTRCCSVLIDHLFEVVGLNRVQINCNVENVRSRAIPERLGFQMDGIQREIEFLHDRFGDWAVYSMLRSEWRGRHSQHKES
jgi:ribosomal-protein-serine acetyltransferase